MTVTAEFNKRPKTPLASLNCDGGYGLGLTACLGFLGLLQLGGAPWMHALRYERAALLQGEWWRLLSAHWVHLGWHHLLLDTAGLLLLWALCARELRWPSWCLVLACATAAIDAGLWWGQPQIQWYVGISGLLHGMWAAGALAALLRRDRLGALLLLVLIVKLVLEHRAGASLLSAALPVVTAAHIYGALGGAFGAALVIGASGARRRGRVGAAP